MKWFTTAVIIFVSISLAVQDEQIFSVSKFTLGYSKDNPGEFFRTYTKASENCDLNSKTEFLFEIDIGDREWSFYEFTSPTKLIDTVPKTYVNGTYIQSLIKVVNDGPCQIDAKVYLEDKKKEKLDK